MKYYYEPNDKWYDTKQELVDAYNEDFEGTHSTKVTIDNWTEEQWDTIWKPNMKKLEIKTEKATLLVVDDSNWDGCIHEFVGVNYTGFKYLGKVSEITEEDWRGIVDKIINRWQDYTDSKVVLTFSLGTATESGLSLLKANGVVLDYDFDDCPNDFCENGRIDVGYNESMTCSLCEDEQQKVWTTPHVFIKIESGN